MTPYIRSFRYMVLRCLMLLFAGATSLCLSAADLVGTWRDTYQLIYNLYDDQTAELVDGHTPSKSEIIIPGYFKSNGVDYVVTKIAEGAFTPVNALTDKLTVVKINNYIEHIDASAFKDCAKLKSIYLPITLKTIDASAFEGCTSLTNFYCDAYEAPVLTGGESFEGIDVSTMNVYVHEGCADLYGATASPLSGAAKIAEVGSASLGQENAEIMISKSELTFTPGNTQTVHISIDNGYIYRAIQFDMYLPDGLSLAGDPTKNYGVTVKSETTYDRKDSHTISVKDVSNGSYRFIVYSNSGYNLLDTKNLITFNVAVADDFEGGEISFKKTLMSDGAKGIDVRDKSYMAAIPEVVVTSIVLDKTEVTLKATQTAALAVTFNPTNATNKKVTWASSDTSVATVSSSGVVTAVKVGSATITATSANGKTASAKVTVEPTPATSVAITKPQVSTINVGESITLSAVVLPELTTDKTVTWSSSNSEVATVDSNGKVTAKKAGNVEITAVCGSVSDKLPLVVTNYVKSLALNAEELTVEKGREATLAATYTPSDADPVNLEWSSSDASIATVSSMGLITCIKPGKAVITVKDTESGLTATCEIIVTDTLYGDADNDGNIAINDVVLIVNYILERNPVGFVFDRADVDRNSRINIVDVTKTVDLVLAQTPESVSRARAAMNTRSPNEVLVIDELRFEKSGVMVIPVRLDTDMLYTAMQFDLNLPEGLEVDYLMLDSAQDSGHIINSIKLGESIYRVMIFSSALATLSPDEMLLEIRLKAKDVDKYFDGGYMKVYNGIASLTNGKGEAMEDALVTIEPFSEVKELQDDVSAKVTLVDGGIRVKTIPGAVINVYTVAGNIVVSQSSTGDDFYPLQNGIYIVVVNGKSHKVILK
ncbi:MAG: Ig-like domain-containing protein [Muribaculaceae bacterium]|nr:Ig-like domain-containing protein [Muribaculaceae bacterium]